MGKPTVQKHQKNRFLGQKIGLISRKYFCFVIEYKGRHCRQSQTNT